VHAAHLLAVLPVVRPAARGGGRLGGRLRTRVERDSRLTVRGPRLPCQERPLEELLDVLQEEHQCPTCLTSSRSPIFGEMQQRRSSGFEPRSSPSSSRSVGEQRRSCSASKRTSAPSMSDRFSDCSHVASARLRPRRVTTSTKFWRRPIACWQTRNGAGPLHAVLATAVS